MPSKEIIVIAMTVVGAWYLAGGQPSVMKQIRKAQLAMFRDLGKTSRWGNPSPWHYRAPSVR